MKSSCTTRAAAALAAALLTVTSARADRPLASETADAIPDGSCQVESALLRDSSSGEPVARTWDTLFSCGLAHDSQAALGYTRTRSAGETTLTYLLAGKTSLVVPQADRAGWGISYSLGAVKEPGLGLKIDEIRVLGLVTRELAAGLLGHANLGWSHSRSAQQDTTLWSLGIETTADFTVAADIFGADRGKPSVSAGFGYAIGGGLSVNLSHALMFEQPRVRTTALGIKLTF